MNAKVFTVFLGRRGYYLDREYKNEPSFGQNTITRMVHSSGNAKEFKECVRSIGATHIVMRTDLSDNYLNNSFSKDEITRFMVLVKKTWKEIYRYNGHAVWSLQI